jgi:hypothetical protein
MDFAARERQSVFDLVIKLGKSGGVPPLAAYAHYHQQLLELINVEK